MSQIIFGNQNLLIQQFAAWYHQPDAKSLYHGHITAYALKTFRWKWHEFIINILKCQLQLEHLALLPPHRFVYWIDFIIFLVFEMRKHPLGDIDNGFYAIMYW